MTIQVTMNNKEVAQLQDNKIDTLEDVQQLANFLVMGAGDLLGILKSVDISGTNIELEELLKKAVDKDPVDDPGVKELLAKAEKIKSTLEGLKAKYPDWQKQLNRLKTLESQTKLTTAEKKELAELQDLKDEFIMINGLEVESSEATQKLEKAYNSKTTIKNESLKQEVKNFLNLKDTTAKAAADPASTTAPLASGTGTGTGEAAAKAGSDAKAGTDPYSAFGEGYKAGMPSYSAADAVGFNDGFINDSWDMINESQKRQKMLMLFFYYARMAMSGDIGAMYQFMRFLAHVIGRDKALQNVWMGTKLLELQDKSREATKELLATDADDTDGKWTKKLQEIKGEEGVIATSQKLITQMMEEFTQIVETLTNVQKSLLDVNGKVLSNLSSWR